MQGLLWMAMVLVGGAGRAQDCEVLVETRMGVILPMGMFPDAQRMVMEMFREIGVRLRFVDVRRGARNGNGCCAPIVVQVGAYENQPVEAHALAYALPYQAAGTRIQVFADRVLKNPNRIFARTLLAHAMVHEITHVVQRVSRHSESGVMKAVQSKKASTGN